MAVNEKHIPVISCMDDLVHHLRIVFESDIVNVERVRDLLTAYKSNPKDWKKYAIFDPYRYLFHNIVVHVKVNL